MAEARTVEYWLDRIEDCKFEPDKIFIHIGYARKALKERDEVELKDAALKSGNDEFTRLKGELTEWRMCLSVLTDGTPETAKECSQFVNDLVGSLQNTAIKAIDDRAERDKRIAEMRITAVGHVEERDELKAELSVSQKAHARVLREIGPLKADLADAAEAERQRIDAVLAALKPPPIWTASWPQATAHMRAAIKP